MDSSRVAEFVLSCALPAERSSAVTGDFMEDAESRGQLWFWASVCGTVITRIISDFVEHTRSVARVGLIGSLRVILADAFVALFVAFGAAVLRAIYIPPFWLIDTLVTLWMVGWQVRCGFWIAERAPQAAIASCMGAALIGWMGLLAWTFAAHPHPHLKVAPYLFRDALLISGTLWGRYRYLREMRKVAGG